MLEKYNYDHYDHCNYSKMQTNNDQCRAQITEKQLSHQTIWSKFTREHFISIYFSLVAYNGHACASVCAYACVHALAKPPFAKSDNITKKLHCIYK